MRRALEGPGVPPDAHILTYCQNPQCFAVQDPRLGTTPPHHPGYTHPGPTPVPPYRQCSMDPCSTLSTFCQNGR